MTEVARKRAEVGKSGKMVARVLITSYALPDGLKFSLKHVNGCPNVNRDDEVWKFVGKTDPRVVSELEVVLRGALLMIGCNGCGLNKECSAGILSNHSQDSEYVSCSLRGLRGPETGGPPPQFPAPPRSTARGGAFFFLTSAPAPVQAPAPFNAPNSPPSMNFLRPGPRFFVYSPLEHCSCDT